MSSLFHTAVFATRQQITLPNIGFVLFYGNFPVMNSEFGVINSKFTVFCRKITAKNDKVEVRRGKTDALTLFLLLFHRTD